MIAWVTMTLAVMLGATQTRDISGTWIARLQTPFGEIEVVWDLKAVDGRITGTQKLPFGDAPIVDGRLTNDTLELVVELESFGTISKRTAKGKIVGDELHIEPVLPQPPPGVAPGGGAPPGAGPGGPGGPGPGPGGPGRLLSGPLVARRGTPTPSYRAASVDYKSLPKVDLPPPRTIPSNALAKTPPMGWNSWNKFRTKIDDKTIREIADAIVTSGMKDAGYTYINIDDGWQWKRDEQGVLLPNPNFPDMKALADYVHARGLRLGIYSSPGPRTCGGFEGSYGHEEIDAQTWASWGIDYLKYDWCSASRIWKDEDMPAVYQRMAEAIVKAGRPMVYSLCQYGRFNVQEWGPRVGGHLWRTTVDIRDQWEAMANIGFSQGPLAQFAAPGRWNDPDMLEIGNGAMSRTEYETHFSLWAMLAAPLIAGNDVRSMSAETRAILLNKEVIAVDQDRLGKAGSRIHTVGETEVWSRPLEGGSFAVGLFNRGATPAEVSVKWSDLKISGSRRVRDLWAHADRGASLEGYTATVSPHGVVMLKVSR
jgi:alpha-galactosidase